MLCSVRLQGLRSCSACSQAIDSKFTNGRRCADQRFSTLALNPSSIPRAAGAFAAAYPEGGPFSGVVVGTQPTPAGKRHHVLEVTARPSAVAAAAAARPDAPQTVDLASLQPGQTVQG